MHRSGIQSLFNFNTNTMFKNAFIYRMTSAITAPAHQTLQEAFAFHAFVPCGATQDKSVGWVAPRGHNEGGAYIESVAGQWVLKLMTETKVVPAQAIKDVVDAAVARTEATTGRKPGKKERKELADDARQALLPHAFPKRVAVWVWIDPASGLLVVDASTQSKADDAVTALVHVIDGLTLQLINTQQSPASAMARWLVEQEAPAGFTVDRECELKACDESKAVVRYSRHALDLDEVVDHISMGKIPTRLALAFADRVSFVLTEGMTLKKIDILDVVFEHCADMADDFDADVAIATGELSKLLPALLGALGGEVQS